MPRFDARCVGLPPTEGAERPPDARELLDGDWCVAITVGNTNEGSEFPAKLRVR